MTPGIRQRTRRPHTALIALRLDRGLSREAVAHRAGISRETVRMTEAGFVPTPRVQMALSQVFGKRPLELWPIETQQVFR